MTQVSDSSIHAFVIGEHGDSQYVSLLDSVGSESQVLSFL
jgi:malate/lactate dehydrogenase